MADKDVVGAAKTSEDEVSEAAETFEEKVSEAADKFEAEFDFSKVETMIHRFPPGLGEISSRYPCMVEPRFVAIGPYHHGKKHLEKMEAVKKAAAHFLFQRSEEIAADDVKEKFLAVDNGLSVVDKARAMYFADETGEKGMTKMKDNAQFADMMICDACFLLLYMDACNRSYGKGIHDDEVNESMRRFLFSNRDSINNDIMLLENQLPWLVIQELIDLASDLKLKEAVGKFIAGMGCSFKICESSERETYIWEDENPPPHLLALLRRYKTENPDKIHSAQAGGGTSVGVSISHHDVENNNHHSPTPSDPLRYPLTHLAPTTPPPPSSTKAAGNRSAVVVSAISPTNLKEIGIELAASKTAAFSDMGLEKAGLLWNRLTLAPLSLGDTRASCLVNMAAFEVCTASRFGDPPDKTAVCSYLALLAFFMVGSDDVSSLRSMNLLNGPGSDDDMLAFFKTLMKHLPDSGAHFAKVMADIQDYKNKRRIRTTVYKWLYNNYVTIIKVATVLGTLIGLYRAFLSLVHKN